MQTPISISAIASVSALGHTQEAVWERYMAGRPLFSKKNSNGEVLFGAFVSAEAEAEIDQLRASNATYRNLDRSVLLAILAAKKAYDPDQFPKKNIGVNIGSSRGATGLFEQYHDQFRTQGYVSAFASPTTTLGNIASWVGQELGVDGVRIEHSITCSTALHAVLNGIAWMKAGMADAFIAGGSEAALTPFTVGQMKALTLLGKNGVEFPCESMRFDKSRNSMLLGEGAAVAVLERGIGAHTLGVVAGIGFSSEIIAHNSAITQNAKCLQDSMRMALRQADLRTVDAVIMHAPGTVKGDLAEKNAIEAVFGEELPLLTSNKWMMGHTFAASGMLSVELALLMLRHNTLLINPFFPYNSPEHKPLQHVMVNAVGFGGNAVSIIISKP
ncbi:MAG: beta-ketoacyl synthase N-terminal-like domain-containing protein [Bacteroidota bacterium]